MIIESWPWKQALLKDADILERWAQKSPSDRRSFVIERKIFLAAYSIRKLAESFKLSSSFDDRTLRCDVYPPTGRRITFDNRYDVWKIYELDAPTAQLIGARSLIDMIIHSFVLLEEGDESGTVTAFAVTSDRLKTRGLWRIELCEFTKLMKIVGNDMPSTAIQIFDPEAQDWFRWQGHGEPPAHVGEKIEAIRIKLVAEHQTRR